MAKFELNPEGGELAPVDTGAAGTDNDNSDGAAGPNKRKTSKSEAEVDKAATKKAAKKATKKA